LWPISRQQYPKQFAPLIGEETLFASTLRRVSDRSRYTAPLIVGNIEHRFFILDALDALGIKDATILLEPRGRNTAAAALAAVLHESEVESPVLHLVLPSDHLVTDQEAFHNAVASAAPAATDGYLVLFGITPDRPETGYGYIIPGKDKAHGTVPTITQFREKPDLAGAKALIAKGALWNSGMFLYDPRALLGEAKTLAADHLALCVTAWQQAKKDAKCTTLSSEAYAEMGSHAFDTLFMEHTKRGAVLPCAMGWSDPRRARHRQLHRNRHPGCRADRTQRSRAGGEGIALAGGGFQPRACHLAYARSPALGHLREYRRGQSLQGETYRGQAWPCPVAANAPSPRRALDRGLRHRQGRE
jgi:mannose-1-phosphate guanylyltransferase/mannose-6-phosphate isomerase